MNNFKPNRESGKEGVVNAKLLKLKEEMLGMFLCQTYQRVVSKQASIRNKMQKELESTCRAVQESGLRPQNT